MEANTAVEDSNSDHDFRVFLKSELMRRMAKNPRYSLRAFAKSLAVDHSTLSQILRFKRKISSTTCQEMCRALGLDAEAQQRFTNFLDQENQTEDLMKFHQLRMDLFLMTSDWVHDAILELTRLKHFKSEISFVTKALGVSVEEAQTAVDRLLRLELLKIENGVWIDKSGDNSVLFEGAFTTPVLQAYQQKLLQKSIERVDETPKTLRDHTSIVLAVDSSLLNEVKEKIKIFRRSLSQFLEEKSRGKADQVYSMQISLFPLTENSEEKS